MSASRRSQLWLATLGAAVALGTGAVPATIQLLSEDAAPTAPAPATVVPAPTVTPQQPSTAVDPAASAQPQRNGRRGGHGKRG
jgi:hypothetical protein